MTRALLATLAIACTLGCAKVNPQLVAAQDAVHDHLTAANTELSRICESTLLDTPCADARPVMREALAAGEQFTMAVGEQQPAALGGLLTAVGKVAEQVKALPDSETARLLVNIGRAISAATARIGGAQ